MHASLHQEGDSVMVRESQAVAHRVEVPPEKRGNVTLQVSPQKTAKSAKTGSFNRRKDRESKNKNRLQEWKEMARKQPPRTRPNHCIKNQCAKLDLTD